MTASATHEVRNVLAIIKESAGLIQDLADLSRRRGVSDEEKVRRAVDRIELQVKRGADLLTNLNRLSHTLDEDRSTVDLAEEVEQLVFLSRRFARQKSHRVEVGGSREACPLFTDPLLLHMTLFSAMRCCLSELPGGALLTVEARTGPEGVGVEFRGRAASEASLDVARDQELRGDLQEVAERMGAAVEPLETGYGIRILFGQDPGQG